MKGDYFIYTGNAYPHKNLPKLIDAVLDLKINLKIVSGRNVFVERLQQIIKDKKAARYVKILGFVKDQELKKIYKNSIAFVFPTLAEGFGLPPKEAIEAGTLAVVSNIPVLKEVYEDFVDYFDPNSLDSIKFALQKVIDYSKEERKTKIVKAQNFLQKYSWRKMAEETLKIYESSAR